jgi:hypothetical protein
MTVKQMTVKQLLRFETSGQYSRAFMVTMQEGEYFGWPWGECHDFHRGEDRRCGRKAMLQGA